MTTLISYVSSGGRRQRCDAHCHHARGLRCRCICGGRNHGVGLQRAMENTSDMAPGLLERAQAEGSTISIARELLPEPVSV